MANGRYIDIPILEAAKRCGVRIDERTLGRAELEAACPFCGDKPNRRHLNINTHKNVYHCKLCGASGNTVSLYAKLKETSYAQAARELLKGDNLYQFPQPPQRTPEPEIKPLPARHDVYQEMLRHLELSARHRVDLKGRGLSDERIDANMYRTLPKDEPARRFLAGMLASFRDLTGIPGFHTDDDGQWNISGQSGLLIPIRDKDAQIQGLQIKLDDADMDSASSGGRRYRWLSSRHKKSGAKSSAWVHVTGDTSSKTAYITEGPLKGDVASYLSDDALFICVPGINAAENLYETVKSLNVSEILLAADMDKVTNPQVHDGFARISKDLSRIPALKIRSLDWNVCFKGIDDYLYARRKANEHGKTIEIRANGITSYIQALWQKEHPEQDPSWIAQCEWEETLLPVNTLSFATPLDPTKIQKYKQALESGAKFPPIITVNNTVLDGHHLCQAYSDAGITHIHAYRNKPIPLTWKEAA